MNPLKLIRKLGAAIRGGDAGREIFLGVFLGFAVGMIPGVNLSLVLCVILLLFLNTNGALAAIAMVIGKALCLLLAPLTFQLGYLMIHTLGLSGVVQTFSNTPVLALLDWQVYCLMGSIPLILILGIAGGLMVTRMITKLRTGIVSASDKSERLKKLSQNKLASFLLKVALGKQKGQLADTFDKKSHLIRKERIIAAVVVLAVIFILQAIFLNTFVRKGIQAGIAGANGAEVNIDKASLSIFTGRLVIEGLQVTDPAKPSHNQLQADRIVSDISVSDLLTRRFVVDVVECDAMQLNAERDEPGEVYGKDEEEPEPEAKPKKSLFSSFKIGKLSDLKEYYQNVKDFNEKISKLKKFLQSEGDGTPGGKPDKAQLAEDAKAKGYLRLSAQDSLAKHPAWVVRKIAVNHVSIRKGLPSFTVSGENLSSHPSLHPEPMKLKASPDTDAIKKFKASSSQDKDQSDDGGKKKSLFKRILGR